MDFPRHSSHLFPPSPSGAHAVPMALPANPRFPARPPGPRAKGQFLANSLLLILFSAYVYSSGPTHSLAKLPSPVSFPPVFFQASLFGEIQGVSFLYHSPTPHPLCIPRYVSSFCRIFDLTPLPFLYLAFSVFALSPWVPNFSWDDVPPTPH